MKPECKVSKNHQKQPILTNKNLKGFSINSPGCKPGVKDNQKQSAAVEW